MTEPRRFTFFVDSALLREVSAYSAPANEDILRWLRMNGQSPGGARFGGEMFYDQHFKSNLPADVSAALFKQSVKIIAVAISSYCNRRCPYCPNSISDRISDQHRMSDDLFHNIMRNLARIDYQEIIQLHRYNEPLSDREYALSRIGEVKKYLPNSKIYIYTNGDYLNKSYVEELDRAGVECIYATVHTNVEGEDFDKILSDQSRRLERLGIPFVYTGSKEEGERIGHIIGQNGMRVVYTARDFYRRDEDGKLWMFDRAQTLPFEKNYERTQPCLVPFAEMQIEWDGRLAICCQMQLDAMTDDNLTLGTLTPESDVLAEWTNPNYVAWRKSMLNYNKKKAPCSTCDYGFPVLDTPEYRAYIGILEQNIAAIE